MQESNLKSTLSLDATRDFVNGAASVAAPDSDMFDARNWMCVDGRNDGADLAGPGGALGALFAVCAGLESFVPAEELPDVAGVYAAVREAMGEVMTTHTDDHHAEDGLRCAGCGHCNGALADSQKYGIVHYAAGLKEMIDQDSTMERKTLTGGHAEGAVLVLDSNVRMPGRDASGASSFVFHADAWAELLHHLSKAVADRFGFDVDALTHAVDEAAKQQLAATLERLAKGLPTYKVSQKDGEFEVTAA